MIKKGLLIAGFAGIALLAGTATVNAKTTAPAKESRKVQWESVRNRWPAEQVSGKIGMVDPQKDLVIVRDSHGVPFDFIVNGSTKIDAQNQQITLSDLASRKDLTASVRFIPERKGDVAKSITVQQ